MLLAPEQERDPRRLSLRYARRRRGRRVAAQRLQLATAFSHGAHRAPARRGARGAHRGVLRPPRASSRRRARPRRAATTTSPSATATCSSTGGGRRHRRRTLGGVNEELKIDAPVPISHESRGPARSGRASFALPGGLLVSLIDLSAQPDDLWDAPKRPAQPLAGVRLSVERSARTRRASSSPTRTTSSGCWLDRRLDGRYDTVDAAGVRDLGARLDPRGAMIRHRPRGRGHPYLVEPDQRVPVRPVAGEAFELRATTPAADSERGGRARSTASGPSFEATRRGEAVPEVVADYGVPAPRPGRGICPTRRPARRAARADVSWVATVPPLARDRAALPLRRRRPRGRVVRDALRLAGGRRRAARRERHVTPLGDRLVPGSVEWLAAGGPPTGFASRCGWSRASASSASASASTGSTSAAGSSTSRSSTSTRARARGPTCRCRSRSSSAASFGFHLDTGRRVRFDVGRRSRPDPRRGRPRARRASDRSSRCACSPAAPQTSSRVPRATGRPRRRRTGSTGSG